MILNPTYQHYSGLIAAQICGDVPPCVDKVTASIIESNTDESFEQFYLPKMKLSIAASGQVRKIAGLVLGLLFINYLSKRR